MLPKKLVLEGIYSYQERQEIDFEQLTSAGLFGIFGATGSGKSTILEAISYALYGENERLNSREDRAYNMMNLKSTTMRIEFEFENYENRRFKSVRTAQRNSKNFSDVKNKDVILYEWINNNWIPLESSSVEELIGLSYKNFKRTIIIPQGQFKEFLELGASERSKMLKEIFNLHRFDLQDNANKLYYEAHERVVSLEGQLMGFDAITQEEITSMGERIQLIELEKIEKTTAFEKIDATFQAINQLKNRFEKFQQISKELEVVSSQEAQMKQTRANIERFENYQLTFKHLIIEQNSLVKKIKLTEENLALYSSQLSQITDKLNIKKEAFKESEKAYQSLDQLKIKKQDLDTISKIKSHQQSINQLSERITNGEKALQGQAEKLNELTKKEAATSHSILTLEQQTLSATELSTMQAWFQSKNFIAKQLTELKIAALSSEKELTEAHEELAKHAIQLATFEEDLKQAVGKLQQQKTSLEQNISELLLKKQIAAFAHALHEGEDCPLCGSKEHPSIVEIDDVSLDIEQLEKSLNSIKNDEKSWENRRVTFIQFKEKINATQLKIDNFKEQIANKEKELKAHDALFKWTIITKDDEQAFEAFKSEQLSNTTAIQQHRATLEQVRKDKETEQNNLKKYEEALSIIQTDLKVKLSTIQTLEEQLKLVSLKDFESIQEKDIITEISSIDAQIDSIETTYKNSREAIEKLTTQHTQLNADKVNQQQLLTVSLAEKENNQSAIIEGMKKLNIQDFNEIEQVLQSNIDATAEGKKVDNFFVQLNTLQQQKQAIEQELEGKKFQQENFELISEQRNASKEELALIQEKLTKEKTEHQLLSKKFKEKNELFVQLEAAQKRKSNCNILKKLFIGNGFMEYVSSIYLRQLCDMANVRFQRMTRNQLSLSISDKLSFEVIDNLNEGRTRSAKTLSGGQAFQASLALALALAESVQSNAKSKQNFFFIDEGFGTQDADSVNTVFETLVNLNKESKIVGIISHVDELKERIPLSLNIVKDDQKGSLVQQV